MTTRIASALHLQSSYMRFFSAVLIVSEQTPQDPIHCRFEIDVGRGIVEESTLDVIKLWSPGSLGRDIYLLLCNINTTGK